MKDKVQKIRNEVERLQNDLIQEREKGYGSDVDDACILELQNVLTYIDSLQEEPVSEELEKAANKYIKGNYSPWLYKAMFDCFKAGAEWQKEQMMNDAIEIEGGEFHLNFTNAIISKGTAPFEKCKVKMIIIKEG
jgi:hypothetical protein